MTNKINGQKLTFLISNDPVFSLIVTDKMVTDIQIESDFIADIILGSLSNRVDETILVKELSSVRLLNSFFSCWSKKFRH